MKVLILPTVSVLLLCLGASDGCIIPECPKNHPDDVIYLPSPTDCSKYYVCVHSEPIQMSCPLGLWFDSELNVCNYPEKVNCDNDPEKNCCKGIFNNHPSADCILYDDEQCDGEEGFEVMTKGSQVLDLESKLGFDIESVSIRAGCQLTIATGKDFSGETHEFKAGKDAMHVTLGDDKELEKFDDNVNSASCSCRRLV